MNLTFALLLGKMRPEDLIRYANQRPPLNTYLGATLLPDVNKPDYHAKAGGMTITPIMAGMVGMSSAYPEGMAVEANDFSAATVKIAQQIGLEEGTIRELQMALRELGQDAAAGEALLTNAAFNLLDKGVLQPIDDTKEYLKIRALSTGMIDWEFNKKRLQVDYGVPNTNKLPVRAGAESYGGAQSKFWEDIRALRKLIKNVRVFMVSFDTLDLIIDNPVNKCLPVSDTTTPDGMVRTVRLTRAITTADALVVAQSQDARDTVTLVGYNRSGNILDVTNPGKTIEVQFMPDGVIAAVGNNTSNRIVTAGTPIPDNVIGYTHIAPTVEGEGRMGLWTRMFVPEQQPWSLQGQAVTNFMPVIENAKKLAFARTEMTP